MARPRWAVLYVVAAFALAGLALADMTATTAVRPAIESAASVGAVAGIALWVRTNRAALERHAWCACAAETVTMRVIPSRRPEDGRRIPRRTPAVIPTDDDEAAPVVVLPS